MALVACIPLSILLLALIYVPIGYHAVTSWRLFSDSADTGNRWRRMILQSALIALWWTAVPFASTTILVVSLYNAERAIQEYARVVLAIAFLPDLLLGALPFTYSELPIFFALYWATALVILLLIAAVTLALHRARMRKHL